MNKKLFVTILSFLLVLTIVVQAFPENKVYAQEDALGNTITYTYGQLGDGSVIDEQAVLAQGTVRNH